MKSGKRHSLQRTPRSLQSVKFALVVAFAGFVLAAAYISALVVERQEALKNISHYNPSWEANQGITEFTRFEQRLSEFAVPGAEVDKEDVEIYYEILLGRAKILSEGSFQNLIRQAPDHRITLRLLNEVLAELQPLINNLERPGNVQNALKILKPLEGRFVQLASFGHSEGAKLVEQDQRDLIQLHWLFSGMAFGLILFGMLLMGLLDRHIRLLGRAHQELNVLVHRDVMTGLANRVLLREQLETALDTLGLQTPSISVLYLDLDHFKEVNDSFGHEMGDALLKIVADRLQNCVRTDDMVARLGGDEFAILQPAASGRSDSIALASRIIDTLGAPYDIGGQEINIGTSIGIAVTSEGGLTASQIMKQADMALYQAKADGRGSFRFFEPEMDVKLQARRSLEVDLRRALPKNEFEVFYQPQIDLNAYRICGFEALLRWHHPERGLISPATFIPITEDIGLITPLGDWIIAQACKEAATWPDDIGVAVNLSPAQFRNRGLVQSVSRALAQSGLTPDRLELEITERILLQDNDATVATLHQLRQLGVRIAMDDFGTGYSSLSYLRSFPFDKIKIDQSFVQEMSTRADCLTIVHSIASLGASLGMSTVAEGVETEEQYQQLRAAGCTEAQGYYFGRPKPARELAFTLPKPSSSLV